MTESERRSLLERVEAVGGAPGARGSPVAIADNFAVGVCEPVFNEQGACTHYRQFSHIFPRRQFLAHEVATLVHALKLDAQARGVSTFHEASTDDGQTAVLFGDDEHLGPTSEGRHATPAGAWLRAWLDTFEDKQEATP